MQRFNEILSGLLGLAFVCFVWAFVITYFYCRVTHVKW